MLSLSDKASMEDALSFPLEPRLRDLLASRIAQLALSDYDLTELTHFLVVEPGDAEADIEREIGFSPLVNPIDGARYGADDFHAWWDWLHDHGGWWEMGICVADTGFAFILFIQDDDRTYPELRSLCRAYADQ
jgi:hypothetical protein